MFNETVRQAGSGGINTVTPYNVRVAVETEVLGLVLRSAVGHSLTEYLQEKV